MYCAADAADGRVLLGLHPSAAELHRVERDTLAGIVSGDMPCSDDCDTIRFWRQAMRGASGASDRCAVALGGNRILYGDDEAKLAVCSASLFGG